ncbi:isochorismate synthase [Actinomadura kijaniata]|uniref:isochorismate synthase n=1 Tax=Actinomadura kijaniata TaxID=46161 RepID=UPI001C3F2F49|nr:isochorismate synthase [Actinomadura kijaniata]
MKAEEFLLASPRGTLRAAGMAVAVPPRAEHGGAEKVAVGLEDLPERVDGVLSAALASGRSAPIVVGAIPFAGDTHPYLFVPQYVRYGPAPEPGRNGSGADFGSTPHPTCGTVTGALSGAEPAPPDWRAVPSPHGYLEAVRQAVGRMRAGELDKVVLARSLSVPFTGEVAPLLQALSERNPHAYTFAAPLPGGRILLGASPELLVSRSGRRVVANPLAGSLPRDHDPATLMTSAKDRYEHSVVVDAVARRLRPYCARLSVPPHPTPVAAGSVWHLSTQITGELTDPATTSLHLAAALHPTPAVCGTPTSAARRLIADLEPFDRGFYTGLVGWQDAVGDGAWVIALRCAVAGDQALTFYAGAGIVADSDPHAELAETCAKFRTALSALSPAAANLAAQPSTSRPSARHTATR